MERPRFKSHFYIEIIDPETVFLLSEHSNFMLRGRLYSLLAPWLNGQHTSDEIIEGVQGQASTTEVNHALNLLERKGYITRADGVMPSEIAAFWNLLGVETSIAARCLAKSQVSVTAFGAVSTEPFIHVLETLNIRTGKKGDLTVVLTDDYLQSGLDAFNQDALEAGRPWLLVKPVGAVLWLGPLFRPSKTGCWACLAQRLTRNREVETYLQHQQQRPTPFPTSRSILPSTWQIGLNMATTEIAKWLVLGRHPQLEGAMITLDTTSLTMQQHILVQRPQCPCCGTPTYFQQHAAQPIVLTSQPKVSTLEGGYRSCRPEQTLEKYNHHVSPITGVVSELRRTTKPENKLIHVYLAAHHLPATNIEQLRTSLQNKSAGKGFTDIQAKTSGLCEAIERYSAVYSGDEYRITGRFADLGETAIHPQAILQFSQNQYQHRQAWNQSHSEHLIPEPFDEIREIEWASAWSLTQKCIKYVPMAYCYFGYPLPADHQFCYADSNGHAAGNTLEEAILQGFMELVERDGIAIWWYNRLKRPGVDLESFNQPYILALHNYYQTLQRELWVLDITSDLEIPTFAAISRQIDQATEDIILGFGAHFDPQIAILRAITEVNQKLPAAQQAKRVKKAAHQPHSWEANATLSSQPYLKPDENITPKCLADYSQLQGDDLRDDVELGVNIAAQHGLETLVLDQTRPDIGLKVVKVIVPGLRHAQPRFAPGRLYDVPVQLGWLETSLTEKELNLYPKPN
ncbi:TOMM precursor leader peptide-binding protein [Chloroflexota bacterium]